MNEIVKRPPYWLHMECDHTSFKCLAEVKRGARIIVPPKAGLLMPPEMVMTILHYCETHRMDFKPETYWTGLQKARFEKWLRDHGKADFRPDFEASRVDHVLVTTPEYQAFLWRIGRRLRAAA